MYSRYIYYIINIYAKCIFAHFICIKYENNCKAKKRYISISFLSADLALSPYGTTESCWIYTPTTNCFTRFRFWP